MISVQIQSFFGPNEGKYGPEKTPYLDTFHTVKLLTFRGIFEHFLANRGFAGYRKLYKSLELCSCFMLFSRTAAVRNRHQTLTAYKTSFPLRIYLSKCEQIHRTTALLRLSKKILVIL